MIKSKDNTISYDKVQRKLIITMPWDPGLIDRMRNIPTADYYVATKTWEIDAAYIEYVLWNFPSFTTTKQVDDLANELKLNKDNLTKETIKALFAVDNTSYLDKSFGGMTLYEHQKSGVREILNQERVILADDLGLGKTLQSLVATNMLPYPIYVVAPISLHENWKREAERLGIKLANIYSSSSTEDPPIIVNYSLIVDEAHYFQNLAAKRTKWFLSMVAGAGIVVVITGTPIKNGRPSNIFPLLTAIRHPLSFNKVEYEINYCGRTGKSKNNRGAANLSDLYAKISPITIRRTKEECLDLPDFTRYIRQADMTPEGERAFKVVFDNLRAIYFQRITEGKITSNNDALVMLTQLRHAASFGKLFTASELMSEIAEEGNKAILFCAFKDSAEALFKTINLANPSALLTSDVTIANRDKAVNDFQGGSLSSLVCTYGTGGVGLNMTEASYVILVDRPWTPGEAEQAEARAHRIGQKKNVTSIWLQNDHIDMQIDELLIRKKKNIQEVLTGSRDSFEYGVVDLRGQAKEFLDEIFTSEKI